MDEQEARENRRRAAQHAADIKSGFKCPKCHGTEMRVRDGKDIGGMPGIKYDECGACGYSRAKTKRPRKEKL